MFAQFRCLPRHGQRRPETGRSCLRVAQTFDTAAKASGLCPPGGKALTEDGIGCSTRWVAAASTGWRSRRDPERRVPWLGQRLRIASSTRSWRAACAWAPQRPWPQIRLRCASTSIPADCRQASPASRRTASIWTSLRAGWAAACEGRPPGPACRDPSTGPMLPNRLHGHRQSGSRIVSRRWPGRRPSRSRRGSAARPARAPAGS
jgi:hypothetical protein